MSMLELSPPVHDVPAASGCTIDQLPLAHCWKDVPSTQFHSPSFEQVVPAVIALPELVELFPAEEGLADDARVLVVTGKAVAVAWESEVVMVLNTPPLAAADELL